MNKNDLVILLALRAGIPRATAKLVVDAVFDSIVEALAEGRQLTLSGFGSFVIRQRAAGGRRNPRTGESLNIAAGKTIAFRASKELRATVQDSAGGGGRDPEAKKKAGRKAEVSRKASSRRARSAPHPARETAGHALDDTLEALFDLTPKAGRRRSLAAAPQPDAPPGLRYLQACVTEGEGSEDKVDRLEPDSGYEACMMIGARRRDWFGLGEPLDEPPPKPDGSPHRLRVLFWEPDVCPAPQARELDLPPAGDTAVCRFAFRSGAKGTALAARIVVYHGNRALQAGVLVGEVGGVAKLGFVLNAAPLPRFGELAEREKVDTSLILDSNAKGECYLCMVADGQEEVTRINRVVPDPDQATPIDVKLAKESSIDGFRDAIGQSFTSITEAPEAYAGLDSEATAKLLCNLAQRGAILLDFLRNHTSVGEKLDAAHYIQIVRAKADAFFPLEYLYAGKAPEDGARICDGAPHAATARKALAAGSCCGAYDEDDENTICPLKFWSLSKVIERHAHLPKHTEIEGDLQVRSAGPTDRDHFLSPLSSIVLAVSDKVDTVRKGTVADLSACLGKITRGTAVAPAGTWKGLAKQVKRHSPHLLVLLPHHGSIDGMDTLEIGGDERKVGLLRRRHVLPEGERKLAPIVLLIGCDTGLARIDLDNAVSAFQKHGAAIIVSTLGSVLGREAGPAAKALVEQLAADMSREVSTFGESMLATRRRLLAAGMPMVLGLTSYGDADWLLGRPAAAAGPPAP